MSKTEGLITAVPTAFREDWSVDLKAIAPMADHVCRIGCAGVSASLSVNCSGLPDNPLYLQSTAGCVNLLPGYTRIFLMYSATMQEADILVKLPTSFSRVARLATYRAKNCWQF
ncbi:MAG: hypothetical protein ACOCVH_01795 [Verrucomicrobiota bacterium]